MRRIKFRAIKDDMSNFNWVYGNLIYDYDIPRIQETQTFLLFTTCVKGTECQFTGLTDKNGKEIYEGDILRYTDSDGDEKCKLVISDVMDFNCGCCTNVYGWEITPPDYNDIIEVIGNIHQNPELMGDK